MEYVLATVAHKTAHTSHVLCGLAGSRRTLPYMQQRAAGGCHGRHLDSAMSNHSDSSQSMNIYLLEEQSFQISFRSDLKRLQSAGRFWRASPQQEDQDERFWGFFWSNKYELRMYYRSGTDGRSACLRRRRYLPGGSTELRDMTSWPHLESMNEIENPTRQSMRIFFRTILPDFIRIRF